MKLKIKATLPLAILLAGSANCSLEDGRNHLKSTIEHAMNFEESLVMALEHPSVMIKETDSKLMNFDKWVAYLHDDKEKEAREKRISSDAVYKFYRLNLDNKQNAALIEYLDNAADCTDLSVLNDDSLKAEIEKQLKIKKDYLYQIMANLPVITDFLDDQNTDDFHKIIKSHIDAFISAALTFDHKRFNFSNLHKALESIKGAVEVPRKARHAAEAAIKALADTAKYDITAKKITSSDELYIKRENVTKKAKGAAELKKEKEAAEKRKREINLIDLALDSANKSTSNPNVLFTTLSVALLLATALIIYNAATSKPVPDEDEEEDDEECGNH